VRRARYSNRAAQGSLKRALSVTNVVAAFMATTTFAFAHAPPEGAGIQWYGSGAQERTIVKTNRGLIITDDAGKSFRMLCPNAFGSDITEDYSFALSSEGRLLASSFRLGLSLGAADLCTYEQVPGPLAVGGVLEIEAIAGLSKSYVALSTMGEQIYSSVDDARTWTAPSTLQGSAQSLALAPNDPLRVYATSLFLPDGGFPVYSVLSSADAGHTFARTNIAMADSEQGVFVVGVDVKEARRAYARVQALDPTMPERLLRTEDAGKTFTTATTAVGPLTLRSVDDGTTWLGTFDGLMKSTDGGKTFARVPTADITRIGCVEYHANKLYVCGYSGTEFGVRVSADEGATFSWFLRFPDVKDQIACPGSAIAITACAQLWHDWQVEQGQITGTVGGGGTPGTGSVPGSSGGSNGAGGTGPAATGGTITGTGGALTSASNDSSGCGCSVPRSSGNTGFGLALAALLTVTRRRRTGRLFP
jgi:MYXO-CTERM domain-containing protein